MRSRNLTVDLVGLPSILRTSWSGLSPYSRCKESMYPIIDSGAELHSTLGLWWVGLQCNYCALWPFSPLLYILYIYMPCIYYIYICLNSTCNEIRQLFILEPQSWTQVQGLWLTSTGNVSGYIMKVQSLHGPHINCASCTCARFLRRLGRLGYVPPYMNQPLVMR